MPRAPRELRLSRMRRLLRRLDDPHQALRIIHITGTKGKGSTAAMIARVLTASGVKTGFISSPHLHALEERFLIDDKPTTSAELVSLVDEVREAVERLERDDSRHAERGSTFFEITTAMGLLHFARRDVGAVVLEVGMGGRLDSTNVVHPALSVITSISFDHTRQLGNTLAAIATEKAGILKRGRPAVSGAGDAESRQAIRQIARRRGCLLHELDSDFWYQSIAPQPPLVRPTAGTVEVRTWRTNWGRLCLPLLGPHQAHNASVALAALDTLAEVEPGLSVTVDDVVRGFAALRWPARVEVVAERPWIVIDGAHNTASALALVDTLNSCFPPARRTLVFGTTREKDLEGQLRVLLPYFETIIATRYVENPRSVAPEDIAAATLDLAGRAARVTQDPGEALALARQLTAPEDLICVTGSLFLAAETRAILMPVVRGPSISGVVM
jgi:dihydrofolate synthase/folylpolyglutamate synthase